ncbi:hypothetical protein ScPMuIL_016726 [Solemya velum]
MDRWADGPRVWEDREVSLADDMQRLGNSHTHTRAIHTEDFFILLVTLRSIRETHFEVTGDSISSETRVEIDCLAVCCTSSFRRPHRLQTVQTARTTQRCENEGETVYVPRISDDPCISCFCKNGKVACSKTTCPKLDGCYMIIYDNFNQDRSCSCDMCKGCFYKGKHYNSSEIWYSESDPCQEYSCRAAVITRSTKQCHTPCSNPISKPGQCCPSCEGCSVEGKDYKNGDSFKMSTDPCVECKCDGGSVTCSKRACPVLNCPGGTIYQPEGSCCPECRGKRKIFGLPGGRCFFRNKIYNSGTSFNLGKCETCTCHNGTIVCDAETCPPLDCPEAEAIQEKGACCRTCPPKRPCTHEGNTYKHQETWQTNICTTCNCEDGTTHCQVQPCTNSLWCPPGYKLEYQEGKCCPACVESSAVCTVFGDPHYRTFDGRMYSFQGTCKYMLTQDCLGKSFSIKVRNDARTSSKFSWTKMLVIDLGNTRISLHPKLVTRVNRKRVKLPFTNHAEFSVVPDGNSIVFKSTTGIKVIWDGDSFVEVSVPSRYRRKLCGLCGNFNGLGTDDMRGKDGRLYYNGEEFGHSWRIGSRGACHIRPEIEDVKSKCTEKPELKIRARKECSLLLSVVFSKCRKRLDVRPYYKSCIEDMCDCPEGKQCACESFKAYAHACKETGSEPKWEKYAECAVTCPEGAVYSRCGPACHKTCDNYNKLSPCLKPCVPGCHCPSGLLLHDNRCIKPNACPKT